MKKKKQNKTPVIVVPWKTLTDEQKIKELNNCHFVGYDGKDYEQYIPPKITPPPSATESQKNESQSPRPSE